MHDDDDDLWPTMLENGIWEVRFDSNKDCLAFEPDALPIITVSFRKDEESRLFETQLEYEDISAYLFGSYITFAGDVQHQMSDLDYYFPLPQDDNHSFFSELTEACRQYTIACRLKCRSHLSKMRWKIEPDTSRIILVQPYCDTESDYFESDIIFNSSRNYNVTVQTETSDFLEDTANGIGHQRSATINDSDIDTILDQYELFYEYLAGIDGSVDESPIDRLDVYLVSRRGCNVLNNIILPKEIQPIEFLTYQKSLFLTNKETADILGISIDTLLSWHDGSEAVPFVSFEKLATLRHAILKLVNNVKHAAELADKDDYLNKYDIVLVGYDCYEDLDESNPIYHNAMPCLNLHRAFLWETTRLLQEVHYQYSVSIVTFKKEKYDEWLKTSFLEEDAGESFISGTRHQWAKEQLSTETPVIEKSMSRNDNIYKLVPDIKINSRFLSDFFEASSPCFGLGIGIEQSKEFTFIIVRPNETIPDEVLGKGFNFGQALLGNDDKRAIQFSFQFYGHGVYHAIINPNNEVVKKALSIIEHTNQYQFIVVNPDRIAMSYRNDFGENGVGTVINNIDKITSSKTTHEDYHEILSIFSETNDQGQMLNWVCTEEGIYDNLDEINVINIGKPKG